MKLCGLAVLAGCFWVFLTTSCAEQNRTTDLPSVQAFDSLHPRPAAEFPCPGDPPTPAAILKRYDVLVGAQAERLAEDGAAAERATVPREWGWRCGGQEVRVREDLLDGEPIRVTAYGRFPYNPARFLPQDISKIRITGTFDGSSCTLMVEDPESVAQLLQVLSDSSTRSRLSAMRSYRTPSDVVSTVEGSVSGGCSSCLFFYEGNEEGWTSYLGYERGYAGGESGSFYGLGDRFSNEDLIQLIKDIAEESGHPCGPRTE